jgi:hypothetical protein
MEGQEELLRHIYYGNEIKTLEEIEKICDEHLLVNGEYIVSSGIQEDLVQNKNVLYRKRRYY